MVRGNLATVAAINDRGGVLGRRMSIVDCDDGPGEVSRAKACIKKLVGQDKVFSLITGYSTGRPPRSTTTSSSTSCPYIGAWAYSQTEWQDPYMFPTHMSMIHEAMAGAHWVEERHQAQDLRPGLPDQPGDAARLQRGPEDPGRLAARRWSRRSTSRISETSMSAQVLAMRAANPEHIIHYVINPATMAKFMVEAAQQNYYPPKGISGNHLAAEVLGSLFGKHPAEPLLDQHHLQAVGPGVHGDHEQVRPRQQGH